MARTKNESNTGSPSPAEIANDPAVAEQARAAHSDATEDRQNTLAEAHATHAEETAKLQQQIADLQSKLDQQKREAQAEADKAGALIPARADRGPVPVAAPRDVQEQARAAAEQAAAEQPARLRLLADGTFAPVETEIRRLNISTTVRGGRYRVNGVIVNAMGVPIKGGKAPASEVPRDLESMPEA